MIKETNADEVRDRFLTSHHQVIQSLNNFDTEVVEHSEEWVREEGGGGKTYAFSLGKFLEKGGINFSDVRGSELPPSAIKERQIRVVITTSIKKNSSDYKKYKKILKSRSLYIRAFLINQGISHNRIIIEINEEKITKKWKNEVVLKFIEV